MLSREDRNRIVVVLVRARNPSNIGAVARAMHDFGFSRLRVVNEYAIPFEAARSAVDAAEVLAAASTFDRIAEAVADCTLVVGTTAVGERVLQHPLRIMRDGAEEMLGQIASGGDARVALLFGSEKTGLSNEELSHCNWLMTIPMEEHSEARHASMNLGQAVAVCLYELVRGGFLERPRKKGETERGMRPTAAEVERVADLLSKVLETAEYNRHHPANCGDSDIRRMVIGMGLSRDDTAVWMGMLRQIMWRMTKE